MSSERLASGMTAKWPDTVERDDDMDDEDYHTREVYANFGLAIYHAQVLEHGVVNLLTIAKIFPDPMATRKMFAPLMEWCFTQVLGKLAKEVTPYVGDDTELLADLRHAVEARNQLVHRYWRQKIELMLTTRGKNRMIGELRDMVQMFINVYGRLDRILLKYAVVRGVTMEDIETLAEERRLKWLALDGSLPEEVHDLSTKECDR